MSGSRSRIFLTVLALSWLVCAEAGTLRAWQEPSGASEAPATETTPDRSSGLETAATPATSNTSAAQAPSTTVPLPADVPRSEQLEAQTKFARLAAEAASAQQALVSHLEKKVALEYDIQTLRQQLDNTRRRREDVQRTLQTARQQLQAAEANQPDDAQLQPLREQVTAAENELQLVEDEIEVLAADIGDLEQQHGNMERQERVLMGAAEAKRELAERAQLRTDWLSSPLHPENIKRWLLIRGPRLLAVIIAIFVIRLVGSFFSQRLAAVIIRNASGTPDERKNRANTLAGAFRYAVTAAVTIGGSLLLLEAAGMDIKTLLGGAAVLGLAVAFGAQSLLKDYFCGFIILLENQYSVNDVVRIGELGGLVEQITLRMTALRDEDGSLHFIPNGNISSVTNMTHTWSRAVITIGVAYKEDVDRVISVLQELAAELRQDPAFADAIVHDAEVLGVDGLGPSAVDIKMLIKTRPTRRWSVKREMLKRIKRRFDELGIEIPYPHQTIFQHIVEEGRRGEGPGNRD